MNKLVSSISGRMSLREPQRESLEILANILDTVDLNKNIDVEHALKTIQSSYKSVEDFEREFPSICFALATGVGKTRLMGAFISYLFLTQKSRHFFVLAPNLTIYEKLIQDFSPESPKYVFKGISEFATNRPVIITGDNYEQGRGVRFDFAKTKVVREARKYDSEETVFVQKQLFDTNETAYINIFNVSKIDAKVKKGNVPRIKQLQEYIGESYFAYLSGLPDLVLLMDEAHRYRAAAGAKAINDLKPILGLELTATPKSVGQQSQQFKNVIYNYPLGAAMQDGLVKEPAVATRKDFRDTDYSREALEQIKLEDGIHHHEYVKVELEVYSLQTGKPLVHPFMLVVAQDITHASQLRTLIESDSFFEGRYKGRVIEVHSNQVGQESDEATQRLLSVEHDPKTEIVIHVNKLKEGWDVTNLYTIVPLRASASEILTEQTIGRGLRLPYGQRTGVESIDRLTIVAHDKFQAIVDAASDPTSIIRKTVIIGEGGDISTERSKAVVVPSVVESVLMGSVDSDGSGVIEQSLLDTVEKRQVANVVLDVVKQFEKLESSHRLQEPEIKKEIAKRVTEILATSQLKIEGVHVGPDVAAIVDVVTKTVAELTIDVPKISVIATSEVTFGFSDFDLVDLDSIRYQPVSQEILIQELRTNERIFLHSNNTVVKEDKAENYLIKTLIDRDEIDYDKHSDLLYKLAGQIVAHLRSYLTNEEQVENVLLYQQKSLNNFIFTQMMRHCWETPTDYEVKVSKGFTLLKPNNYNVYSNEQARDFRAAISERSGIRKMMFTGFKKCCYPIQKFDSDSERRFAVILEDDKSVLRWMKPAVGHFQIEWKSGIPYQPDFVVETTTEKFICEPKALADMTTEEVQLKAIAAKKWCAHATQHAVEHGGKAWSYLLIPHTEIVANRSLDGLKASFQLV
jgi:type III restriction enzyme